MKHLRWLTTLAVLLVCTAAAFADSTPPDGAANTGQGVRSSPITMQGQAISFPTCMGSSDPDCAAAGPGTQSVFGGLNETGVAWNELTVVLNLKQNPSNPDLFVSCSGGGLFTNYGGGCNAALTPTQTSVTLEFFQGTGTGIGCTDGGMTSSDFTCLNNSNGILATQTNGPNNPYDYYNPNGTWTCPAGLAPGAVCGSNDFFISLGATGEEWNTVPLSGTLYFNPEPPTFPLVGGAMLAILVLGLKKAGLSTT
jgi:hypothetical protein